MSKLLSFLKMIFQTPIFVYSVFIVFICVFFLDIPKFKKNVTDQSMNRFSPVYSPYVNYLKDFAEPRDHLDPYKLHECIYYHQKVVEYYPFERFAGYAVLGFCNELLGNSNKALKEYQATIEINPNDFWAYYNLGVIYYKKGDYPKAVSYFQQVLLKNLEISLYVLYQSKIYRDISNRSTDNSNYDFIGSLKQGREMAYIFLLDSLMRQGSNKKLFEVSLLGLKENLGDPDIFYYYAGRALFHQKSFEKAVDLLKLALQKDPNNADALLYLSFSLREAGQEELAQKLLLAAQEVYKYKGSKIEKYLKTGVRIF